MTKRKNFNDLDQAIDYIINQLNKNERDLIKNADPAGIHLAPDRWIKNDFVFNDNTNLNELIYEKV